MTEDPDIHAEERIKFPFMTWRDETPAQRLAVHRRRAAQAVIDNPEMDDAKLGEEWGISPALIAGIRSPEQFEEYLATHDVVAETYAKRVADEFRQKKMDKARLKAFQHMVDNFMSPKERE